MIDFLMPGDAAAIIEQLADPAIRIVSLTITEGGYFIDPASGVFNPTHPDIVADAGEHRRAEDRVRPDPGRADAPPRRRHRAVHRHVLRQHSPQWPCHLGRRHRAWPRSSTRIWPTGSSENVAFPNGMVDRITPATTDRERAMLASEFGVEDNWPVFCEPFRQWVLEDNFTAGRPALEKVGVQFVKDVSPFELMKIRILNGGHATIAYPAGLMDIHFVHEAMQEPLVRGFLAKLEHDEIIPTVPPVPGVVLEDYYQLIEQRFSNPKIGDTMRRLCLDGSNRQPKFIIPTIADRLTAGKGVTGLALESALWCRYCFGTTDSGAVIEPNDPNWDRLQATAKAAKADPAAWLAMDDIYGEVGKSTVFADAFAASLKTLWEIGTRQTLTRYLSGTL